MAGIEELGRQALADIAAADSPDALEALRVSLLGKSGSITAQPKSLGALPGDQRKAAGEAINKVRDAIGEAVSARKTRPDAGGVGKGGVRTVRSGGSPHH